MIVEAAKYLTVSTPASLTTKQRTRPQFPSAYLLYNLFKISRIQMSQIFTMRRQRLAWSHYSPFRGSPCHIETICMAGKHYRLLASRLYLCTSNNMQKQNTKHLRGHKNVRSQFVLEAVLYSEARCRCVMLCKYLFFRSPSLWCLDLYRYITDISAPVLVHYTCELSHFLYTSFQSYFA